MTDQSVHDHWIDTEGGRLFTRAWGALGSTPEAPAPIILFHDSLGSVELWRDFPDRLSRATGRGVIAYDRLGFGRSDPHPGKVGPGFIGEEATHTLPALRAQLGVGAFVAFGHSVGGAMAVCTAAAFPDACKAVITEAAQAFVEDRTLNGIAEARTQFADPAQVERLAKYHGDKARWVLDAWIETWFSPEFADWTLDAALAQVRCPLLAMHGDNDEYGSLAHPNRIAERSAGPAEVVIFDRCGHVPHRETPERVLEAVKPFLAPPAA